MNATLKFPVLGFTEIRLIMKGDNKWLAVLIGADLEIEVSENDFFLNKLEKTLKLQTETDLNWPAQAVQIGQSKEIKAGWRKVFNQYHATERTFLTESTLVTA